MNRFLLTALAVATLTLSACDSTDPDPVEPDPVALNVQTASNVYAPLAAQPPGPPQPASGPFKLYSLRTNSVVANADSNSTSWDLAFRSTEIRVNGGASGPGQGQAVVLPNTFDELTAVPAGTAFRTDGSATCPTASVTLAICTGSGNGWYTYDQPNNLIFPTAGRTILVRTADGAGYAKVRIRSYYQNAPATPVPMTDAARYYTFDYILNPSGTSFEFEGDGNTTTR